MLDDHVGLGLLDVGLAAEASLRGDGNAAEQNTGQLYILQRTAGLCFRKPKLQIDKLIIDMLRKTS